MELFLIAILFVAIVIWNVYAFNHFWGKALPIFPEVNSESFLFSEKNISGHCESGLVEEDFVELGMPKFITDGFLYLRKKPTKPLHLDPSWSGRNLQVYITSKELWISSPFPLFAINKITGNIHKAPFSKVRTAEIIENRPFLYFTKSGKLVKLVIETDYQKDAVMVLKMKKADEFLKIINDKIAELPTMTT